MLLIVFVYFIFHALLLQDADANKLRINADELFVMPWMCLERCDDSKKNIEYQLTQLAVNVSTFTSVSFEDYNLGANSTLIKNDLSQVAKTVNVLNLESWAMISSFPYPPDFLYWMREVFMNPQPFIDACLKAAVEENLTGFNIDWEPTSCDTCPLTTDQDALDYANFLNVFANAMHEKQLLASVDVATWQPIWNIEAISATNIDYIMTMNTYTTTWESWESAFNKMVAIIPREKFVVGLECDVDLTEDDLKKRFDTLNKNGIRKIAVWRTGIPDLWWPYLDAFTNKT